MKIVNTEILALTEIRKAAATLKNVAEVTPLMRSFTYSNLFDAHVLLKREDLQQVRSYKIRGAFNKISSLSSEESARGIVCASAGNHAQGVAYSCKKLQIYGTIIMPAPTPKQKIEQVQMFGGDYITIELIGDTFDDAQKAAKEVCEQQSKIFVHPFNDKNII